MRAMATTTTLLLAMVMALVGFGAVQQTSAIPQPQALNLQDMLGERSALSERLLRNLRNLEEELEREQLLARSNGAGSGAGSAAADQAQSDAGQLRYELPRDYNALLERLEGIRRLRRNNKRNYNLDHLARMNFRRSFRASSLNNRHILGGLKK